MLVVCVLPALTYGLETMALTKEQEKKIQVCENNWVRRLCGVRLADKRRLKELREEVGLDRTVTQRVVEKRLKWAGHLARMEEDRLAKRAARNDGSQSRSRGRPRIRWSDCIKRDLTGVNADKHSWWEWVAAKDVSEWSRIVTQTVESLTSC